tara:strand:+ start:812 stop:1120 length:309 start_codon:yes stop_codon:yes gene_type:complete
MNKEHYYNQTDRQRLSSSQRQVMSLEHKITELSDEIVRLTLEQEHPNTYMLDTLKTCHDILDPRNFGYTDGERDDQGTIIVDLENWESLRKDLRKVISFLKQ